MKIPGLRWWIASLLFCAAILNYVDRQTLSLLAPTIQADLGMNDNVYAGIVNAFLVAYILSSLLSGRLVDAVGTRISYTIFVGWWSVANVLTGFAHSSASLGGARAMLGLGEAGNWTASPKAVSEWFPARERALAIGIYTMGGAIGATIAPVFIVPLATRFGWQAAFCVTGLLGLLWLGPWLCLYRLPQCHPLITDEERTMLARDQAEENAQVGEGVAGQVDVETSFRAKARVGVDARTPFD